MTTISTSSHPRQATFDTVGAWKAPVLDQATLDMYVRRGRQERAKAFSQMIRSLFSSPASRPSAEVHALPTRTGDTLPQERARAA